LTREGDAVKAGMELGDTIIAVNGKNVTEYSWEEEYNIDNLPNIVLDVIGVDGKEKQISLESKERW
jgi:predicted metalloprotease with PDZ domain